MRTLNRLFVIAFASSMLVLAGCNSSNAENEAAQHIERSQVYAEQGQYRSAMIELRNAIQKDPGNVEPVVRLADILLSVGGARQASDSLESWIESEPNAIALTLATAYMQQGKHISAREALDGFSPTTDEERARRASLLADSERLLGNHDQAVAGYRQAIDHSPGYAGAVTGLARSYMDRGQYNDALNTLDNWLREFGNDPNVLYLKGLVHYQLNELENAVAALTDGNTSIRQSDMFLPERRQILGLLSRTLTEQGDLTQAMVYNNILSENTDTELSQTAEAAMDALRSGDLDTARATLEDLIQRNPDSQLAALLLGAVTMQQDGSAEGAALLTDNIDAEVTPVPFIRMAAMAQIDQGKRNEALATLERALLARPGDADLLSMHGILALSDPQHASEGVISLTKALQVDETRSRLRLALAQHFIGQNQLEQGLGYLRTAFERTPTDWSVTDYYLSTLLRHNYDAEAAELKSALETRFQDEPYANVLVALTDYHLGNHRAAMERLQRVESQSEGWSLPIITLAQMQSNQGDRTSAIETYLRAAEADTSEVVGLQMATRLYSAQRSPEDIISWLNEISTQRPVLSGASQVMKAQINIQLGRFDEARTLLEAVEIEDDNFQTLVYSQLLVAEAQVSASQQLWSTAKSKAAEAITLRPRELNYRLLLVRILAAEREFAESRGLLDDLESDFGSSGPLHLTRALVLRSEQGERVAYEYLKSTWDVEPNPQLAPELIRLARLVAADEADAISSQWVQLQPQNVTAWQIRGDLLLSRGDESAAAESYRRVLDIAPQNIIALNNLAWTLRDTNPSEAVVVAERAVDLAPENPSIMDTYGWVLHKAGRNQEALSVLQQALNLDPGNADIQSHIRTVESSL